MGTWSTAIDGNDTFLDVYTQYFYLYNKGCSAAGASAQVKQELAELFDDDDDRNNALFALALAHWETQLPDEAISTEVRHVIETEKDLALWKDLGATDEQLKERQVTLSEFLIKISYPKTAAKRRIKPKFEFSTIELVMIASPDNLKTFSVNEEYINGIYVHTGSALFWNDGGGGIMYFNGQGKPISARWIDSQTLEISHQHDIIFTKQDQIAYYNGDHVNIIYVVVNL